MFRCFSGLFIAICLVGCAMSPTTVQVLAEREQQELRLLRNSLQRAAENWVALENRLGQKRSQQGMSRVRFEPPEIIPRARFIPPAEPAEPEPEPPTLRFTIHLCRTVDSSFQIGDVVEVVRTHDPDRPFSGNVRVTTIRRDQEAIGHAPATAYEAMNQAWESGQLEGSALPDDVRVALEDQIERLNRQAAATEPETYEDEFTVRFEYDVVAGEWVTDEWRAGDQMLLNRSE